MTPESPIAYPIPKAAEMLGIGRSTLYEEIRRGRLRPIKVGRRSLLSHAELTRYLAARQAEVLR
jgi:excisionase family DNA binding protein